MEPNKLIDMEEITLRVGQICSAMSMEIDELQEWVRNPVEVDVRMDIRMRHAIITLRTFIAEETLDIHEVRYPETWWDAVKDRFFPSWMLKRWPAKFRYVKIEAKALYPKVSIPEFSHTVKILSYNTPFWKRSKYED